MSSPSLRRVPVTDAGRFAAWFLAVAAASGWACGSSGSDGACSADRSCAAGRVCVDGRCVPVADGDWADAPDDAAMDGDADAAGDGEGGGGDDGIGDADAVEDAADAAVDSDGDTILDADEGVGDADGDTVPNALDPDSDGDSYPDSDEAGDADPATPPIDSDGDTVPDFLDPGAVPCALAGCPDPGEYCPGRGTCVADCRNPAASACGAPDRCDWITGTCVAPDAACALFGEPEECPDPDGATPLRCGPGTACDPSGSCVAWPPCWFASCSADGLCRGERCACERPAATCSPASLADLSRPEFTHSAMDLEFDDACHAYVVTMISGTDYLREMLPDGTMNTWASVANLNMGEVAVLRRQGGEFGGDVGEAALTYICCSTCGCAATPPQGVAHLDRATGTLPHVIEATTTSGSGPFGVYLLDTGPYGLTWGRDRNLYVGNVHANGEVHRIDLDAATTTLLATLPARVTAQAPFDLLRLLVALEGGAVHVLHTRAGTSTPWVDVGEDVTSVVRDPFTGRVYVEGRGGTIREFDAGGTERGVFAVPARRGRISLSPDGGLYHVEVLGADTSGAEVTRYALPATR